MSGKTLRSPRTGSNNAKSSQPRITGLENGLKILDNHQKMPIIILSYLVLHSSVLYLSARLRQVVFVAAGGLVFDIFSRSSNPINVSKNNISYSYAPTNDPE